VTISPRHARQTVLPGVGAEGQARLASSHAVIVGVGALGCVIADLLCRAGVGKLTLIDRDVVEETNLQRQTLFTLEDARAGLPKVEAAASRLRAVDPAVTVRALASDLHHRGCEKLIPDDAGVILDGTDNFETRYLLNDYCVKHAKPLVYGGVIATRGMQATFRPGATACLRCLFQDPPAPGSQPTCETAGVLGPAAAIIGATQAADALKVLLGRCDLLSGTLLEFDLWANTRRRLALSAFGPRADCPCCGLRRFEFLERPAGAAPPTLCGRNAVQVLPAAGECVLDLPIIAARLRAVGTVRESASAARIVLPERDGVNTIELTLFADGRAIVHGTARHELARSIYAKYVGV
jgi:adenylyltransferase/sulfurtransferase